MAQMYEWNLMRKPNIIKCLSTTMMTMNIAAMEQNGTIESHSMRAYEIHKYAAAPLTFMHEMDRLKQ